MVLQSTGYKILKGDPINQKTINSGTNFLITQSHVHKSIYLIKKNASRFSSINAMYAVIVKIFINLHIV